MNPIKLIKLGVFYGLLFNFLLLNLPVLAAPEYRLYISPTPRDATIKILNIKPKFRQGIRLPVGRYDVLVSKKGYHSRRFWVELSNRSRRILVTLKAQTATKAQQVTQARLFIKTHPPQARIKILNIKPPFQQGMSLTPGTYDIEVSHPQFITQRHKIQIKDKDLRLDIQLEVEEALEQMLRQPPTQQTELEQTEQTTQALSEKSITAAKLTSVEKYALYVTTEPADAEVSLLNTRIAFQQGMLLPPGAYQLKISKSGYTPRMRWVEIQRQELRVHVRLSEPEYCFSNQEILDKQVQQRQVRLHFYLDYVEAWYSTKIQPAGALHKFRLLGQRQGNEIDLVGTAYYEQQAVELRSHMQLQDKQLIMYFDGQKQILQQVNCSML